MKKDSKSAFLLKTALGVSLMTTSLGIPVGFAVDPVNFPTVTNNAPAVSATPLLSATPSPTIVPIASPTMTPTPIHVKIESMADATMILNDDASQIKGGANNGFLELTNPVPYVSGSAFLSKPVRLSAERSFSAYFTMKMSNAQFGGADGIVFVIAAATNAAGKNGGGIGYQGLKDSIGIEFDSWNNFAVNGDPDANHIAINHNGDLGKPLAVTSINALTTKGISLDDGGLKHAWIEYDSVSKKMEIRLSATNERPEKADLTATNLDLQKLLPPDPLYVGFTSATGGGVANHLVKLLYFDNNYLANGIDPNKNYVQNQRPELAGKSYTITEDAPPINDIAVAVDEDNNVQGYKIVTAPKLGKVTLNSKTGEWTYTPNQNANGNDSFEMVAFDPTFESKPATFNIQVTPVNDPPLIEPAQATSELGVRINIPLVSVDQEKDPLTFRINLLPSKGTATIDPKTGTIEYVPFDGASGLDTLDVIANDGKVDSLPTTVKINITAKPKVSDQSINGLSNKPIPGQVKTTSNGFSDGKKPIKYIVTKQPEFGTVELAENGTYKYTPNNNFVGTDIFEFAATDGTITSDPAKVEIKILAAPSKTIVHSPYMQGYPDGLFKPQRAINRAELAAALVRLTEITAKDVSDKSSKIKDVKTSEWLYAYASQAVNAGWIQPNSKGQFGAYQAVTRAELVKVIELLSKQNRIGFGLAAQPIEGVAWLSKPITDKKIANAKVTRREAVLILNTLFKRGTLPADVTVKWSDVPSTDPHFTTIMEASIKHESELVDGKERFRKILAK